jgi:hypothetical protein
MLIASQQVLQQGIYIPCISFQYPRPIQAGETVRKLLRAPPVFDPQENVVMFGKGNSISRQFALKPIVSIHINLYLHGKPRLQLYVYQTKFPIHEVKVNEQAFPSGRFHKRAALLKLEGKSPAWFQYRENADQASLDSFFLGHLSRKVFLSSSNGQILNGTAELVRHCFGMLIDPVGTVSEKPLQIPEHYMILI